MRTISSLARGAAKELPNRTCRTRIHYSTFALSALFLLGLTALCIWPDSTGTGGAQGSAPGIAGKQLNVLTSWTQYESGWPKTWLHRSIYDGRGSRWQLYSGITTVSFLLLFTDIVAIFLMAFAVGFGMELRMRRRSRWTQFTLLELLLAFCVCAAFSGYLAAQSKQYEHDLKISLRLEERGHWVVSEYSGPAWLERPARLIGVRLFCRTTEVAFHRDTDDSEIRTVLPLLTALKYCSRLNFNNSKVTGEAVRLVLKEANNLCYFFRKRSKRTFSKTP